MDKRVNNRRKRMKKSDCPDGQSSPLTVRYSAVTKGGFRPIIAHYEDSNEKREDVANEMDSPTAEKMIAWLTKQLDKGSFLQLSHPHLAHISTDDDVEMFRVICETLLKSG